MSCFLFFQEEEQVGMIPRAVEQVFRIAGEMKSRGWEYAIEGEFLEIVRQRMTLLFNLLMP